MIHYRRRSYLSLISLAFCNIGSFDSFALQPSTFTLSSPDDYNPDNSDPLDRAIECLAKIFPILGITLLGIPGKVQVLRMARWFMTLDPETNSRLETVFTLIVADPEPGYGADPE